MALLPLPLMPWVRQQYFDGDGAPLANGRLDFFIVGTTTPLEVFEDADGNTSLGTSVDLNASGRPQNASTSEVSIYLQPTGYKVELFDGSGVPVLQWSQDQVEDVGAAFLARQGQIYAEGSKSVDTGYVITNDDNFVTVDGTVNPTVINLQPSADRQLPLWIKNMSAANTVAVTPNGAETIDGVSGAFTIPVSVSPIFSTAMLLPLQTGGYQLAGFFKP